MILILAVVILSYLLGSFPTAILAGRIVMKDDIRNHGSGNAGATNVFRVMGWKPALIVVIIDIGKGVAATLLVARIAVSVSGLDNMLIQLIAGIAAIIGHVWTVFAGFRGGKGMGTAFGVLLGLAPFASLVTFSVWLILVLSTRIVSVGSIAAGIVFPLFLWLQSVWFDSGLPGYFIVISVFLGLLVIFTHRSNIRRLLRGEENRFGQQKTEEEAP